jgi:hypothetical protein
MANCVNKNSKEFKALAEQSNINPIVLAAKVSLWQESNGLDKFPTVQEIQNVNFLPEEIKIGPISKNKVSALLEQNMPSTKRGNILSKEQAYALIRYNKKQTDHKIEYKATLFNENTGEYVYKYSVSPLAVTGFKRQQQEIANRNADASYKYRGPVSPIEIKEIKKDDTAEGEQLTLFMPSGLVYSPTNYNSVIEFKKNILKETEKKLKDAQQKTRTDKSVEVKQELRELTDLKAKLNKDINSLINDPDIFSKTMSIFNNDIAFMQSLIEKPTLENLHLAESYINYFKSISNYSGTNITNTLVDISDPNLIDPDIKKKLDELTVVVQNAEGAIMKAKKEYLLEIIGDSDVLKTMFGNSSEDIRDIILAIDSTSKEQSQQDLDKLSKYLLSADFSFTTQDLLGQLIVNVLKEKKATSRVEANTFIQSISEIEEKVKEELLKLNFGITYFNKLPLLGKHISEVSYDLFYQKTSKDNKTGRLIGKFSHKWFHEVSSFMSKNSAKLDTAIAQENFIEANETLVEKYNWLNEKTDFIQLQKLPEIIDNPEFAVFSQYFDLAESQVYREELKKNIGEYEYNKLVENQTSLLETYMYNLNQDLNELLLDYKVNLPSELPLDVLHSYNIGARRRNPFEFIKAHNSGQQGRVDYQIGSQGNQYQSLLRFNTFIPKKDVETYNTLTGDTNISESGYYDKNFSTIENNPTLLKFWETISEATEWMNNTLNDSNTPLSHNSILRMEKSVLDILLSKNNSLTNKAVFLKKSTAKVLKSWFTKPVRNISESDKVALTNVQTIQDTVNKRFKTLLFAIANAEKRGVKENSTVDLTLLNSETVDLIQKITEVPINDLIQTFGKDFPVSALREVLTNQVMEEQTFNLPVMLRAYLDATGTYKAQKKSLPKISILKDLYETIKKEKKQGSTLTSKVLKYTGKKTKSNDISDRRINAEERMNYWVNKAVKNRGEDDMSELSYYWGKLGRTYTVEEKDFIKQAQEYLNSLSNRIDATQQDIDNFDPNVNIETLAELEEIKNTLINEKIVIQDIIDNSGHYYAISAVYDTVASKLTIFKGLAWNVKAQIMNRFQGIYSAMLHDTGKYWTEGAIYPAMAFINRKGLRRVPGMNSYKQEIKKTRLFIEMLGILQDATNELDRAKNSSGLTGATKKLNPYYLTEYTEWHNQTPMVLAMLSDQKIKSETLLDDKGEAIEIPIFNPHDYTIKLQDGSIYTVEQGFPAYNIEDGNLILKDEFLNEENEKTWKTFSSLQGKQVYNKIDTALTEMNGDYRKDAAIFAKKGSLGRSMLTFKSWAAMNYYVRYAKNTTNINLGVKDFDGAYTGALKGKTAIAGGTAIGIGVGTIGFIASSTFGPVLGAAFAVGMVGYGIKKAYAHNKAVEEESQAMAQLAATGKAILKRGIGLPVNLVSGKNIVKAHTFDELNLSEQEKQNLKFIINEITNLSYILLIKVLFKSLAGDDEEKEPQYLIDPKTGQAKLNPKFGKENEKTGFTNYIENTTTELIQSGIQYLNPITSWDLFTNPASLESWFNTVSKLTEASIKTFTVGPNLSSGPDKGKNRIGVVAAKAFLPGIVGEWALHSGDEELQPYAFGFGNSMRQEYDKKELIDTWYVSDYKADLKKSKQARKEYKESRIKYWEKHFQKVLKKYEDNPSVLKEIEDHIKSLSQEEAAARMPYPNRSLYNSAQQQE